jgi:SAM-dependent methyltransferase
MADAPLVIGGTGGSGTRAVTRIVQRAGWFMGSRLNGSQDSLDVADFDWRWGPDYLRSGVSEAMREDFERTLDLHLAQRPGDTPRWGWKHPHSYILLPFLAERFPDMRFVHVIRDGRDIAFAKNQNQVSHYGEAALGRPGDAADPVRRIEYWAWANERAGDDSATLLGERALCVRLEDLCADPEAETSRILRFLDAEDVDPLPVDVIEPPPTLGRGRRVDGKVTEMLEAAAGPTLRRFGYGPPRGIAERVAGFDRWHYAIGLGDVRTPISDERLVNRHEQRRRYFFDPLVELCGGSLEGLRILDLGCNAGFWALCAIEAGCEHVLGLDARAMHVQQAELVFEARDVDPERYEFRRADVFDVDLAGDAPFDLVLCLGLLYHVSDPIGLVRRLGAWSRDLLVIDTSLSSAPSAAMELRRESTEDPRNAIGAELVLRPSRRAVIELARESGFQVLPLEPRFTSYEGAKDYEDGRRQAMLCAKRTPLPA